MANIIFLDMKYFSARAHCTVVSCLSVVFIKIIFCFVTEYCEIYFSLEIKYFRKHHFCTVSCCLSEKYCTEGNAL